MDRLTVHFTIQKGQSFPTLQKCTTGYDAGLFYCPFCPFFKPKKRSKVRLHLEKHLERACYFGEYTIHKCGLDCRSMPHYHCLFCESTVAKKEDFNNHVSMCYEERQKQSSQTLFMLQADVQTSKVTPEKSLIPSSYIESSNESEWDDITTIPDIWERDCKPESSSLSVTQLVSGSKTPGSVGSMMRDQMVQTNMEKPQDCDEYYFMNLVKMFKKLCPKKKSEVRMKIERILFEAEFQ